MRWEPAPDRLVELIEEDFETVVVEAAYVKMPFYRDGYLVSALLPDKTLKLVLGSVFGVTLCEMTGTAAQLHMANRIGGLDITRENVAYYTAFYCAFLLINGGTMTFAPDLEGKRLMNGHRVRAGDVRVGHRDAAGMFRVGGYGLYADQLFRLSFKVHQNGNVDLVKEQPLGFLATVQ